jgi:hypothetical protein
MIGGSVFKDGESWRVYQGLEQDFLGIVENIALVPRHNRVYSMGFVQLMLSIGGFVDTTFQQMLRHASLDSVDGIKEARERSEKNAVGMGDYRSVFENHYRLSSLRLNVHMNNYGSIRPFDSFSSGKSLIWWKDYTALKHNAFSNMKNATMRSCLLALGALFLLNVFHIEGREALVELGVIGSGSYGEEATRLASGYLKSILCSDPKGIRYRHRLPSIWAKTQLFRFTFPHA